MNRFISTAAMAAFAAFASSAVHAATAEDTMGVSATVTRTCTVTAEDIAFGNITEAGGAEQTSAVSISCTAGSTTDAPTVTFTGGAQLNATSGLRQLIGGASGTALVPYTLAAGAGGTNLTPATTVATTNGGNGTSYTTSVYGRIAGGTYDDIGAYSDTVTVTVTYAQ